MAPKSDKHKSAAAAAAATSDNLEDLETGSAEALARTVKRLHELQTACLQETSALSAIVTSNKQATEVNAQTIKGVEGLAKDTKTELALTNARIETMSMKINTMDQRIQTAEKLLELNKKVSECRETVSQRELNDSALFLALNGIEMSRPAKDLDLHNPSDRKVVEDALEKALGTMASGFVLKRASTHHPNKEETTQKESQRPAETLSPLGSETGHNSPTLRKPSGRDFSSPETRGRRRTWSTWTSMYISLGKRGNSSSPC